MELRETILVEHYVFGIICDKIQIMNPDSLKRMEYGIVR